MINFTIFPAIDLRSGAVVRLEQGQKERVKHFGDQPALAARQWISQGAEWLHVVNLDGAFGDDSQPNLAALETILAASDGKAVIQYGGGLRTIDAMREVLSLGAARVILGTAAVEQPNLMQDALLAFGPDHVILGLDARDGFVQVAGWERETRIRPAELASRFMPDGLNTIIYTNIRRDGMQRQCAGQPAGISR